MSDDSTKKININKVSLGAVEKLEEQGIQFSIVHQLSEEGSVEVSPGEEAHSDNRINPGIDISNIHLLKLQSDVDKLESQIKLISTYASEAKLLESEMNKIIKKIYSVQPKLKPLLIRMKKLLKDHSDLENVLMVARDKVEEQNNQTQEKVRAADDSKEENKPAQAKEEKEEEPVAGSMADFTREIKFSDFSTDGAA